MQQLQQQQLIKSIAFVLMPDHLHWQFQLLEHATLAGVVRTFKGQTATTCRKYDIHKLWQKGYYDHLIRDENDLINQARYIVANPLRTKLVTTVMVNKFCRDSKRHFLIHYISDVASYN